MHPPAKLAITKPPIPRHNGGLDNENYDLILHVNDVIGGSVCGGGIDCGLRRGSRYRVARILGQGTFGQVAKCIDVDSGRSVAVKVLKNKLMYFKQGLLEVGILTAINSNCDRDGSNHTLRILDHFLYKRHLCVVTELLGMNLYEVMRFGDFQTLTMHTIRSYLKQVLLALAALEQQGVVHCDLKPENIMIDGRRRDRAVLIDFGSAAFSGNSVYTYIQSRHYRAPEVILECGYSCPIDMWSLGCVAAELFIGHPLFPGSSEYNQLYKITQLVGDVPDTMLSSARKCRKFYNCVKEGFVMKTPAEYTKTALQGNDDADPSMGDGPAAITDKKYVTAKSVEDLVAGATIRVDPSDRDEMQLGEIRYYLTDFLKNVLMIDPQYRMTASEALRHPFITGIRAELPKFYGRRNIGLLPQQQQQQQQQQNKFLLTQGYRIDGSFEELYSAYCRLLYDVGVVIDANTNIALVTLNSPVVPPRDATAAEERPPITTTDIGPEEEETMIRRGGGETEDDENSIINSIRSRAKHVTPAEKIKLSCMEHSNIAFPNTAPLSPPPPPPQLPFSESPRATMRSRKNTTDVIMSLIAKKEKKY